MYDILLFITPKYYSFNPPYFSKRTLKFDFNSIWSCCDQSLIRSTYLVCILKPLFLCEELISSLICLDDLKMYIILQFINISMVRGIVVTTVNCQIVKSCWSLLSRTWDFSRWSSWKSFEKLFVTEKKNIIHLLLMITGGSPFTQKSL